MQIYATMNKFENSKMQKIIIIIYFFLQTDLTLVLIYSECPYVQFGENGAKYLEKPAEQVHTSSKAQLPELA